MEAWLKVSKGLCESGHYLESNYSVEIFSAEIFSAEIFSVEIFSAEIFSAEIFSAEIFTAEPSLRNLHCETFTANSHCGSRSPARKLSFSASILLVFHM